MASKRGHRESAAQKHLRKLRTSGFRKLRDGLIHMRCPECGRKQSNVCRDKYDPPHAYLVEILCEKCNVMCKNNEPRHYDTSGNELPWTGQGDV